MGECVDDPSSAGCIGIVSVCIMKTKRTCTVVAEGNGYLPDITADEPFSG